MGTASFADISGIHTFVPTMEGALKKEDEEIAALKAQLAAHQSLASNLHSRLRSTLDLLSSKDSSLATLTDKLEQSKRRAKAWKKIAQEAEEERDDMRNVVLELVERVEEEKGAFRSWPVNRMTISKTTQPSNILPDLETSHDDTATYAQTLVTQLTKELAHERVKHREDNEHNKRRIEELETQVGRCEEEIEWLLRRNTQPELESPSDKVDRIPINEEETIAVLELTDARNEALQDEIKLLGEKVNEFCVNETEEGPVDSNLGKKEQDTDLGPEIEQLLTEMNKFREEREAWHDIIKQAEIEQRLSVVEDECARLRQELELYKPHSPPTADLLCEDDDGGERSMELDSPLL